MLSSLNLAALRQANKRRRRQAIFSPREEALDEDARGEASPMPGTLGTARGSPTPDFLSGEDVVEVASVGSAIGSDLGEFEQDNVEGHGAEATETSTADSTMSAPTGRFTSSGQVSSGRPASPDRGVTSRKTTETRGSNLAVRARSSDDCTSFVLVAKEHLVGTWLAVFVRASVLEHVSDVRSGKAGSDSRRRGSLNALGSMDQRGLGPEVDEFTACGLLRCTGIRDPLRLRLQNPNNFVETLGVQ